MILRRRTTVLVAVAAAVAALSAFTSDVPLPQRAAARATGVVGYIEASDGLAPLRRNLPALTSVAVDGIDITDTGAAVSAVDPEAHTLLVASHSAGRRAELLVGNYSSRIGDFDPASAHRLLASPAHRHKVIATLVADMRRGWDGVHLDFESLQGRDIDGLTAFTTELRAALPRRKSLSMAVMASTTRQGYRDTAYDLPALARQLTHVVLMAYDQHGPTWTGPGPVGGLPWVKLSMRALLASVPRSKAVLGVAGYGYTWPTKGTGTQLSDAAARAAAEPGTAVWDATQGEWHATLASGGRMWWSDARSLRLRRQLASSLGVIGVAVWSLRLSDRIDR